MTAYDYDSQLLESVSVRRRRMRDALLFGSQRQRRSIDERIGKVFAGVVIAAVVCAGCVGWSFVSHRLMDRSPAGPGRPVPSPSAVTPSAEVSYRSSNGDFPMIGSSPW
ncbi:hypothetical protein H8N00_00265 [Streptomyces sp. AC563]|uniref:hypothetical protein n=1 Tax=Streptomyces buecherae TaxID=2763006 RepID=UPI00164D6982|nr:hypothetical protein [Streptomyces buecherae]MBC3987371.1 hypothetical protein [Streptomyces buecherae]